MNVLLLMVGKTEDDYLKDGIAVFEKRLKHYINYQTIVIPSLKNSKNLLPLDFKAKEGEEILKYTVKADVVILLDEKGKSFSSKEFAAFIQKQMNSGIKNLLFVVGGAFGFSDKVYEASDMKLSLSDMTFSHQMIRLLFTEQLYRAFTILKNEPYHNE
ncbi:MAG: 23S rRNA (pseudouridine(1915)-N(3))-methyltransferase RlmH [Bacteroidetes bacterium]|nr:23S rRNA (pseudouridine(1915)-N(3))-methyltransferase RlmH [Bacteroidota bacterium]